MPCCANIVAAQTAQFQARERRSREAAEKAAAADTLELSRPPEVAVPREDWDGGDGAVHQSPALGLRRRCGDGAVFTPINENSTREADLPTDRSNIERACWPIVVIGKCFARVLFVLNSIPVQTFFYIAFVGVFQLLTESLRLKEEYHFDKMIADSARLRRLAAPVPHAATHHRHARARAARACAA
jgi:hypothetical protein